MYYPFGLKHKGYNNVSTSSNLALKYKFNGKELQDELGLNWHDYGARNYDAALGKWMSIDPLAEDFVDLSPYNFSYNNPLRFLDIDGRSADDIIIKGENNSSITIETDLIDIEVNAGSIVGDLGGNYNLEGEDILVAALDVVGIADPTGVADVAAASIEAKNGNWGSAILSGIGVIPYIGDIGKVGKIGKHTKTIKNAIKAVNGNSKVSEKAQHVYGLVKNGVEKVGISGGKISKADKSYRATSQVNKLKGYTSEILEKIPAGKGARTKAIAAEKKWTNYYKKTINKKIHKRPKPQ